MAFRLTIVEPRWVRSVYMFGPNFDAVAIQRRDAVGRGVVRDYPVGTIDFDYAGELISTRLSSVESSHLALPGRPCWVPLAPFKGDLVTLSDHVREVESNVGKRREEVLDILADRVATA